MKDEQKFGERGNPIWETVVMACSFGLLWAWFWVRQNVMRTPGAAMPNEWNLLLGAALLALVVIMIRRLKRVKRAFEEQEKNPAMLGGVPLPYGMPDPRGEEKRRNN
jgi:hypothetical protein